MLDAVSAKQALAKAKRKGKKSEFHYKNDDDNPVYFEFIGVLDLLELGLECEDDEVWYDIVQRLLPSERRSKLIPPEAELNAIKSDLSTKKQK